MTGIMVMGPIKGAGAISTETKVATAVTKSAAAISAESEEMVTVYRGVASDHPGYAEALEGKATPIGGPATPRDHNYGDTRSEFTSWTKKKSVADEFATTTQEDKLERTHGVVLSDKVPESQLIKSPDESKEKEVLRVGPISGAKVEHVPKPEE